MKWIRSRRVFISYAHEDVDLRKTLALWLKDHGFEPEYDDTMPLAGKRLAPEIRRKIRRSDCVIALGTRSSFASEWVEAEVRSIDALLVQPAYVPVLAEEVEEREIPKWFIRSSPMHESVAHAKCLGGDFDSLEPALEGVTCRSALAFRVGVALALLLIVPLLIAWIARPLVDGADRRVRELQEWAESVNREIEERRLRVATGVTADGLDEIRHVSQSTGALVARDVLHGEALLVRSFHRFGREVARDTIVLHRESGRVSRIKNRQIFPEGADGLLVEDTFDAQGRLISKRMRVAAGEPWTYYAERGRSIYPSYPLVALYR